MSTSADSPDPGKLEKQANAARAQVDHTQDALERRFSVKSRVADASAAIGAAATRARRQLSPPITTLIRLDHTHVLAAFRRFHSYLSPARKQSVVENACLALEIHAQLEQEIFYPALLAHGANTTELDESVSEHDEMRAEIAKLRALSPHDTEYDQAFLGLIRTALHHVANEETVLIPFAETALRDQLGELGWKMTARRIELLKPHASHALRTTAATFPVLTAITAISVLSALWLIVKGASGGPDRDRSRRAARSLEARSWDD